MRSDDSQPAAVKVAVRCRPSPALRDPVRRGFQRPEGSLLVVDSEGGTVSIKADAAAALPRSFRFDHVFGALASQEEVYRVAARTAVLSVTNGFNSTVFAYGQTGSGKWLPLTAMPMCCTHESRTWHNLHYRCVGYGRQNTHDAGSRRRER